MLKTIRTLISAMVILFLFLITFPCQSLSAKELTHKEISQAYYKSYNYEKSDNITDAIKSIRFVYDQYKNAYGINSRLAHLYTLNGQYRNAISHYQKAIIALPNALTPKLGLLYVYILSKNYTEGSKIGYQIISIDHYNYYGNIRLAHVLRKTQKFDLAHNLLEKILILYPSDTLYLAEFGELKFDQKKYREAKSVMQEVLILEPENIQAKKILLAIGER